jgi:hypothetical protein
MESIIEPAVQKAIFSYTDEEGKEKKVDFDTDEEGFVKFDEVSRWLLHRQTQYGSRFIDGGPRSEYPAFGKDLRIKGDPDQIYSLEIHKDDVNEFVKRVEAHENR